MEEKDIISYEEFIRLDEERITRELKEMFPITMSVSMELLNVNNRNELFDKERPIYTKVRDDMPAIYGLGSSVKGSLVSSGCIIDGEVENSILFRGVRIEKGAVVKNSIIMQDSFIGTGSSLNCVVLDKKVAITPHKHLSGDASYPVYVGKGIII